MAVRVLLADDSATMRRVVQLTLEEQGFEVISVADGQEALAALMTARPSLALLSVTLQGLDGFAVARAMRARPEVSGVPVLLLAGAFDTIDDARVQQSGAAGVLIKPYEPGLVIRRVKELLGMAKNVDRPGQDTASTPAPTRLVTHQEAPTYEAPSSDAERPDEIWEHLQELSGQSSAEASPEPPQKDDNHVGSLDAAFHSLSAPQAGALVSAPHATDFTSDSNASAVFESERHDAGAGGHGEKPSSATGPSAESSSVEVEADWAVQSATSGELGRGVGTPDLPPAGHHRTHRQVVPVTQASFGTAMPAADAFAALLAVEQGEAPPPSPGNAALDLTDDTLAHLSDRVSSDVAAHLLSALPHRVVQGLAPSLTEGVANRVGPEVSARLTDAMTDRVIEGVAGRVNGAVLERLSGPFADRLAYGLAERVAELVAERMMQSSFGESLQQTVRETSERLVREEIDRIRARAASQ